MPVRATLGLNMYVKNNRKNVNLVTLDDKINCAEVVCRIS